ncbi:flagellar motor switch protein FliM [Caproiciproducens sp. NJN-50]|uniref:flagellar motor switch protein FliM n=1 Tax=Acutalibacteraceae TaxID=3082771 RepID=UPI000FFE170E|nr:MULTISPECIES: flagellar motor switch protein FliM [Acutalibacteraceae]QAT50681.1 flagellar motor switch protein FliM [Caproiciproducens sp. NJN-50]
MAEVLSQQQIDDLLGSLQSGSMDFQEIEEQSSGPKVKDYDFLSPKKFTREQIRLLQNIFESFSRLFSLHLSGVLRMNCQAEVLQVEEEEYKEFGNALSDSVLIGVMGLHSAEYGIEDKQILVEMTRPISFCILDRMLGGSGTGYQVDRDYTEIELSLLNYLFQQIAPILKDAWGNYVDVEHTLDGIETNSQLIQFIQPDESAAIVVIEVTLNDLKGNINICLPASSLEEIFKIFDSKYVKINRKLDPAVEKQRREQILESLKDTPLTVSALLGKTEITLRDLLELQRGDVIPLESPVADDSVVLQVEKLRWFTGRIGVKKKNYAVKIGKVLY